MDLKRISYPLFGLFLIIAISCKKEKGSYPNISILEPAASRAYQYQDTIFLKVEISNLAGSVVVTLLKNGETTNIGFTQSTSFGNRMSFEALLDDPNLLSGNYTIRVQAYNGENRSSEFLQISYQEAQLSRLGYACLLQDGMQRQLAWLPENGSFTTVNLNGDYPFLQTNSALGYLFVAPAYSGRLSSFDVNLNKLYDLPNPAPGGSLQYHQLISDGKLTYALDNEGYIRAYRESNTSIRNYQLTQGRIPLRGAFSPAGDMLIAAAEPGFNQFNLFLLNPVNGYVLQSENLSDFPVGVGYSGSDFFILCARGNASIVYRYSNLTMNLIEWARIEGEAPVDIASTADRTYIATNAGLYAILHQPSPGKPVTPLSDRITALSISDISGDYRASELYFSSGNSLYVCNDISVSLVHSIIGKQISKVEVLYNK